MCIRDRSTQSTGTSGFPMGCRPSVLQEARAVFEASAPASAKISQLDVLRNSEYPHLDGHAYMDYTGGNMYSLGQLQAHAALLKLHVFGNPHSGNPASLRMTLLVEQTRAYIFEFFKADPAEYTVIFTPNATGAIKLVAEAYPFQPGSKVLITDDNHNSMNGIADFGRRAGAEIVGVPISPDDLRVDSEVLSQRLAEIGEQGGLFGYPAQSNVSGVQHPLEWVEQARDKGWDVVVDCAAFAPTNTIDMRRFKPDFMPVSFYKMFGYPTGVGALVAKTAKLGKLERTWYPGGTVIHCSKLVGRCYRSPGAAGFEDGTVNYLAIPAVEIGLRHLERIGMRVIHDRTMALTGWLLGEMAALKHNNGVSVIKVYGPRTTECRGSSVAFNVFDMHGVQFEDTVVEGLAHVKRISLRSGCHCNPGAREAALEMGKADLEGAYEGWSCEKQVAIDKFVGRASMAGIVRASVGISTTFEDVFVLMQFLKGFANQEVRGVSKGQASSLKAPGLVHARPPPC
eukprot:TRINITY_DN625_c0_g1_i3.p1 TRINITY_DN625_c0_g1~~TRINITY_DN625_c0_g1_i3.p1  ORF type:complete len:512 (+),score=91.94 TRINITY_DN625_c0_g1_i3:187-1722(+)